MADFTNRNADETKEYILTFDENGGSPEYTKIEDANGVDRTAEVVELLGINDKASLSGAVIQTVSVTKTNAYVEAVDGAAVKSSDVDGLIASITPKFDTSKILVFGFISGGFEEAGLSTNLHLFRDGSEIASGDPLGDRTPAHTALQTNADNRMTQMSFSFLDDPQTGLEVDYSLRFSKISAGVHSLNINRTENFIDSTSRIRAVSTITVMEIGA